MGLWSPRLLRLAAPALALVLALAGARAGASAAAAASEDEVVTRHSRALIVGTDGDFRNALAALRTRGNPDAAAAMILAPASSGAETHDIFDYMKNWHPTAYEIACGYVDGPYRPEARGFCLVDTDRDKFR